LKHSSVWRRRISSKTSVARLEFLAAISGVLIAIQARANGQLSKSIDNSVEAALISFSSGFLILILIALSSPKVRAAFKSIFIAVRTGALPRISLFAGTIGGIAIAVQTRVMPLIGVALYSVASIAGQTGASLIVDRLGISGSVKRHISSRRVLASVITLAAVVLSVADKLHVKHFALFAVVITVIAGAMVGVQRAWNGQINSYSGEGFATSLLNFIMGTSLLILLLAFLMLFRGNRLHAFPHGPWWIYLGGITGLIYIAFSSIIVQHLGALTWTFFSVGGQLLGSLLIDLVSPTEGARVSMYLVAGIGVSYVGVLVAGETKMFSKRRT
jgi:transporter family-2 protein